MNPGGPGDPDRPGPHPLRGVAWILGLALVITLLVVVRHLAPLFRPDRAPVIGDGRDPATYGFDLTDCLVPCDRIVASGLPRDGIRALDMPQVMTAAAVDSLNHAERGKYLVPGDRVVGVVLGGVARAYPLRVLNWHEVVNDTVGGRPVAVTFHPLCESVVVLAREVAGEDLRFGVSGLLYNSNLLMYDRRPGATVESLWCQLQARAVTGPAAAAGRRLEILPAALVTWDRWRTWHPRTTTLLPDPEYRERYGRDPYGNYLGTERLRFPVRPLPEPDTMPLKARVVVVPAGGEWGLYPLGALADRCARDESWRTRQGEVELSFTCRADPATAAVFTAADLRPVPVIFCLWFAWYAMYTD